jgi:hypothetical protein
LDEGLDLNKAAELAVEKHFQAGLGGL